MIQKLALLITVIIMLIIPKSILGQISIGIQGGVNYGHLNIENMIEDADVSYVAGFTFGGLFNYKINESYNLQAEPRFIQKNHGVEFSIERFDVDSKIYFDYLELPLNLIYTFNSSEIVPFIIGGVNIGYLMNVTLKSNTNGEAEEYELTSEYKEIDVSLGIGTGLKYGFRHTTIMFDIRYSYGIIDISKREGDVNTRGIQLLFGILYQL